MGGGGDPLPAAGRSAINYIWRSAKLHLQDLYNLPLLPQCRVKLNFLFLVLKMMKNDKVDLMVSQTQLHQQKQTVNILGEARRG